MTYEPTLAAKFPAQGAPGIAVSFGSFAPTTASVNLYRSAGGRVMLVRGAVGATVSGGSAFFDAEAPFGIPSTYFANQYDSSGNFLGNTGNATLQLDSASTWVQNVFDPAGAIPVRTAISTGVAASQIDVSVGYPVGRRAGVAVTGLRRGLSNAAVQVYTLSEQQRIALDAMFGQIDGDLTVPPFLCIRIGSGMPLPLPRPLFVAVPAPTQTPINPAGGGHRVLWDISGPEIDPPAPAIAQALLSRNDLDAYYASRNAMDAAYASRLARDSDYNLAGYAG